MTLARKRALLVVAAAIVAAPIALASATDDDAPGPPSAVVFSNTWTNDDGTVDDSDIGDTGLPSSGFDLWPGTLSSDDPTAAGSVPPRLIDDAAICTATIHPGNPHAVDVTIDNAYPQYVCTISVVIENTGSAPVTLDAATISQDPGLEVIDTTHPPLPIALAGGSAATSTFSVRILNDADQLATLGFTIGMPATNPPCGTSMVFGVERGTGDLYEIDPVAGLAYRIADIADPLPSNVNSPNGLAYDASTGRLYFSVALEGAPASDLYFWDGSEMTYSGTVVGQAGGAAMLDGEYYFVRNATDDLIKVSFEPGGAVATEVLLHPDFGGADTFRFGDLAVDGTTLVGSTLQSGTTPPTFFSLDLASGSFTALSTTNGIKLQIAFGDDGALYGQSTATGEFFAVDPATGTTVSIGTPSGAVDGFTDLASARCP